MVVTALLLFLARMWRVILKWNVPRVTSLWVRQTDLLVLRLRSHISYERVQVLDHTLDRLYALGTRAPDNEDNNTIDAPTRQRHLQHEPTGTPRKRLKGDLGLN